MLVAGDKNAMMINDRITGAPLEPFLLCRRRGHDSAFVVNWTWNWSVKAVPFWDSWESPPERLGSGKCWHDIGIGNHCNEIEAMRLMLLKIWIMQGFPVVACRLARIGRNRLASAVVWGCVQCQDAFLPVSFALRCGSEHGSHRTRSVGNWERAILGKSPLGELQDDRLGPGAYFINSGAPLCVSGTKRILGDASWYSKYDTKLAYRLCTHSSPLFCSVWSGDAWINNDEKLYLQCV